jgi:CO/xanthine dehydrogenase FAD-binding subunit
MKQLSKFKHINARTIEEAASALASGKAMVNAGGTDLIGTLRFYILRPEMYPQTIVNIKTITPSLDYIKEEDGKL